MHLNTLAFILPACMALPEPAPLVSDPQSIAQTARTMPGLLKDGLQSSNTEPILGSLRSATRATGPQSVPRVPVMAPRSTSPIAGQQYNELEFILPSGQVAGAAVTGYATILLSATSDVVSTVTLRVENRLEPALNITFTAASLLPFTNYFSTSERVACNFSGTYVPPGPSPTSASAIRTGFRLDSNFTPTTSYTASSGAMASPQIQCSGL